MQPCHKVLGPAANSQLQTLSWMQSTDLVTSKPEGSQLRFEIPDHDTAVQAARDELLHVVVECH